MVLKLRHSINCIRSRSNLKEKKRQYVNKTVHLRTSIVVELKHRLDVMFKSHRHRVSLTMSYCSISKVMSTPRELVIGFGVWVLDRHTLELFPQTLLVLCC